MLKSLLLVLLATCLPSLKAESFCNKTTCPHGEDIDCRNPSGQIPPEPDCYAKNAIIIDLTSIQAAIVKRHNQVRNRRAGGTLKATRMGTMRWNAHLATFSKRVVKYCRPWWEKCVNTPIYNFVGENAMLYTYPRNDKRNSSQIIMDMIEMWVKAEAETLQSDIKSFKKANPLRTPEYYRFCQMVRDGSTRMGCSAMRYEMEPNSYGMEISCLYDLANIVSKPVYDIGTTASKCKTGKNANFPNLCSWNETYNVNAF